MTPFDLVFIVVVLMTMVSLVSSGVLAIRGRRGHALQRVGRLALGLVAYMGIVTVVSLVQDRRVVALGEDQCSDDWCVAVVSAVSSPEGDTDRLAVDLRLSSRALRVDQRERFVVAYVLDSEGRRYDAEPVAGVPFDTLLGPGEAVVASRSFRVMADASDLGVVVAREGDLAFPRCCIIGQGPFFEYPIVPLDSAAS
jgi:hypothetical protein